MSEVSTDARSTLQSVFGFAAFREGQQDVVDRLLAGKSVLAIFPTGAGKSLCYQLPALMLDGVTVVVSPLIALMKDQIDFLVSHGVAAARLDSSVGMEEGREVYRNLFNGTLKLLYIAPERLANERFLQTLRRLKISMLAVDEAHCISEWGHNFRPDYMKLAALAKSLGVGRVLALTATATPSVAKDIAAAFDIAPDDIVQTGFYRPNLSLRLKPVAASKRDDLLLSRLNDQPRGPAIVYVTLQKTAEDVATLLQRAGLPARAYHAGLDAEVRHEVQDWFMQPGTDGIVVATIAFGMGIDKSDIRYVYHYNLPKSLENYAQEVGRAGRDGKPSVCEMLASSDDLTALENFTFGDTPAPDAVAGLLRHLLGGKEERFDVSTYELSSSFDVRPLVIDTLLTYLELDGLIESTGPFYNEYKFIPQRPSAEILAKFDPNRQAFLRQILKHSKKLAKWFLLDINAVSQAIGEPRERIVSAINFLEEQGDFVLQVAGARHGYRRVRRDVPPDSLATQMTQRFADRERRDIERLAKVCGFVSHQGCATRYLLAYFGEERTTDCGHCGWCQGDRHSPLPLRRTPDLGDPERDLIATLRDEAGQALKTPRQMTRFLCGITSPGLTRAKLTRHPQFGAWAGVPFQEAERFIAGSR